MFHHVYKCPKCLNTLLVSNKMLHDLRCTYENPATYENVLLRQSQQMDNNPSFNNKNSNNPQSFGRTSIKNGDGTMIEIVKEKNMRGKEELIELKYDPQGNIISRKKADQMSLRNYQDKDDDLDNISEEDEFNYDFENDSELRYDNNNNTYYEVNGQMEENRRKPSIIVETAEAKEIVYEAPAQYDPHVIINKPIEHVTILDNGGLSGGTLDDIIRNTLTRDNDNNSYNNFQNNNLNIGGEYNYSHNNDYNINDYSQSYDVNNYNNQSNNTGSNDIYNNQSFKMNDNNNNTFNDTNNNFDFNSYNYQY